MGSAVWGIYRMADHPDGALILDEVWNGAAEKAGLWPGDIIIAVNGAPIKTAKDLKAEAAKSGPYTFVNLTLKRADTRLEKTILPRGVLRLEVKDIVHHPFVIPGVPQQAVERPLSAADALENFNVLKQVIIDRASGSIQIIGSYDPKYATGPIPYLDLLKTALKYPEPGLNLLPMSDESDAKAVKEAKADLYGVSESGSSLLFAIPEAERERQMLILEMAANAGITREEFVILYNYAFLDTKEKPDPPEIVRIIVKMYHHLGWNESANAYEQLQGNTSDNFAQALKILGKGEEAQKILNDSSMDKKLIKTKLLVMAWIAIMENAGLPPRDIGQFKHDSATWEGIPEKFLDKMYHFISTSMYD
ncbi:MAG: PDZ domain-containing protein, partial [Deltaproteobacteria bacterium]